MPFPNDFAQEPLLIVHLPLIGDLKLGDASLGLCGGMTLAALDYFISQTPPPAESEVPLPNTPLSDYLITRQMDSLFPPFGMLQCYYWTVHANNADLLRWSTEIIPQLKHNLLLHPIPLTLIKVHAWNPQQTAHNHQVLLYEIVPNYKPNNYLLRICDPNYPKDDTITLTLSPEGIQHPDYPVRGFYQTHYFTRLPP